MWEHILEALGINPSHAVGGFAGGLVNIFWMKTLAPIDVVAALIIGTLTAVYLGRFLSDITHLPVEVICFFLGAGGSPLLGQIVMFARQRIPGQQGGGNASP